MIGLPSEPLERASHRAASRFSAPTGCPPSFSFLPFGPVLLSIAGAHTVWGVREGAKVQELSEYAGDGRKQGGRIPGGVLTPYSYSR